MRPLAAVSKKKPTAWLMGTTQPAWVPETDEGPKVLASSVLNEFGRRVMKWKLPDFDKIECRSAEEAKYLVYHYIPEELEKADRKGSEALLDELNKWYYKAKKGGFPLNLNEDQQAFLRRMFAMRLTRSYPASFGEDRKRIWMACIDFRLLVLPPMKKPMAKVSQTKAKRPKYYLPELVWRKRIEALKPKSDWELVQMLTFRVGSRELKEPTAGEPNREDEVKLIALNWKAAWALGPEKFAFGSRFERWWAEKLAVVLPLREVVYCPKQIKRFKQLVGFMRVPVWDKLPVQYDLFGDGLSAHDAFVVEVPREEALPFSHAGQYEIQYWDGAASQQELFVEEVPWLF